MKPPEIAKALKDKFRDGEPVYVLVEVNARHSAKFIEILSRLLSLGEVYAMLGETKREQFTHWTPRVILNPAVGALFQEASKQLEGNNVQIREALNL